MKPPELSKKQGFWAVILGAAALGLLAYRQRKPAKLMSFLDFPEGFVWGAATSAYQVEGGIRNDWSAAGLDAGPAADHYHRYAEDFVHAQNMGHNAHRFSLEWARIEPEPGRFDEHAIAHYRQVLQDLHAKGLTPFVTLWHFTQPEWFARLGGWQREENIASFLAYVRYVVTALQDLVPYWITLNEPIVYAFQAYEEGLWPPFEKERSQALQVARHLLLAHGRAWHLIHELQPDAQVGLVKNMTALAPAQVWSPLSLLATRLQHRLFNEACWQALVTGKLSLKVPRLGEVRIDASEGLKGTLDFIGVNYYTRNLVNGRGELRTRRKARTSELGWEIYPEGLLQMLRHLKPYARKLKVPVYITENGLADAQDAHRSQFLLEHLAVLWQAIQEGIPVKGYFHWSLMDNFEWAEGFTPRFGLMDIARRWRPSAEVYREIARHNGFPLYWLSIKRKLGRKASAAALQHTNQKRITLKE